MDAPADVGSDARADATGDAPSDVSTDVAPTDPASAEGWSPRGAVGSPGGDVQYNLRLAADGAGNTLAAWMQGRSSTEYTGRVARWTPAGAWEAPTTIVTIGPDPYPELGMNATGDAVIAWRNNSLEGVGVFAQRYVAGVWQPREFASGPTSAILGPGVAVAPSGAAFVAWTGNTRSSGQAARVVRYAPGEGWGTTFEQPERAAGVGQGTARVAVDSAGMAWMTWGERSSTFRGTVAASVFTPGAGWSTPASLSAATTDAPRAELVSDGVGTALAVWIAGGTASRVESARFASGAWGAVMPVTATGVSPGELALTTDPAGRVTAVWWQFGTGPSAGLWASRFESGAWSTPVQIRSSTYEIGSPDVAADAAGNVVTVWREGDLVTGVSMRIWSSRLVAGASAWSTPVALSVDGEDAVEPVVAAGGAGVAVAGWLRVIAGGEYQIVARTRTTP